jgi:hypothetical protein
VKTKERRKRDRTRRDWFLRTKQTLFLFENVVLVIGHIMKRFSVAEGPVEFGKAFGWVR